MSRKTLGFWLVLVPDLALLYLSLWLSVQLRYGSEGHPSFTLYVKAFSWLYFFWLLIFFIHSLFEIASFRRYTTLFFNLLSAMVFNLGLAVVYFYFQPNPGLTPKLFLLINVAVSFGAILLWHLFVKYVVKNRLREDIYIFSFNNELAELEQSILQHPYLGYRVQGHLNEQTLASADFRKTDSIILPENLPTNNVVIKKFYELRTKGVKFYNTSEFYENLLRRVYLSQISEIWFLENINYQEKKFYNIIKRIVDVLLGLIGFVFFLVSWPFVALAIKLTSPGPVLFVQERTGKRGEIFKVYKYRSMSGGPTNTWTSVNDPRITPLGKFLRKSRIDEWPQFINLLLGHISLVGPRPEQPHIVEDMKKQIPFYDERHLVKPGITGWAQLNIYAGSVEETKLKLQYDLYYIKHRSFLFDLEIILKTVYYIFTWQGR